MAEILDAVLSVVQVVLIFGVTISFLVFIHEGGHFLVAKWSGVWVHEFAIGMGPAAWRRKQGETEYTFRILPIGGYVRMAGEDGLDDEDSEIPEHRLFSTKSGWTRSAIIFAGPFVNIVAAFALMIAFVSVAGMSFVEVAEVAPNSPAQGVLQSGDKIVRLDGEAIYSDRQIPTIVQNSEGEPISAVIQRGDRRLEVQLDPYRNEDQGRYLIGVYFAYPLNRVGQAPEGSTLAQQGFQASDEILAVGGASVGSWTEVIDAFEDAQRSDDETVPVRIRREEETQTLTVDVGQLDLAAMQDSSMAMRVVPTWTTVRRVEPDSVWAEAGLQAGDRVLSANGLEIHGSVDLVKAIERARGDDRPALQVEVERANETRALTVSLASASLETVMGDLQLDPARRQPETLWAGVRIGSQQIWDILALTYFGLKQVFTGQMEAGQAFVGPVGIADLLGQSIDLGFGYFLRLVALLSLMLGIFNLLPFPALDGSRIVLNGINGLLKMVIGKPIPPEKEGVLHYVGFALLMALVLFITWNDIERLFTGGF